MLSTLKATLVTLLFPLARAVLGGRRRTYRVHGRRMRLDVGESRMMLLRALGLYELRKVGEIRRRLGAGGVFVDVGANQGDFALLAAGLVGPGGRVLAFEPEPGNAAAIRSNIALNGLTNVELREAALSDRVGTATLHRSAVSGWHSLRPDLPDRDRDATTVAVQALDDLGLPRLDLLKIDVEGAEAAVIAGARDTLYRHRPVVLLDTHPQLGADVAAMAATFRELGYEAHPSGRAATGPVLADWPDEPADLVLVPLGRPERHA